MRQKIDPRRSPGSGDGGSASALFDLTPAANGTEAAHRLRTLESQVEQQRRLLGEAARYLGEAAYLARYHQPALERHIRAFLGELPA